MNITTTRLPRQLASALALVHSLGVVHGDLGLHNLLLTDKGDIVLCDFAGSGIDGRQTYVAHSMRYSDPCRRLEDVTQQHDVFALGSLMYELVRGELLFEGLEDEEIYNRLERKEVPDISELPMPLRGVIEKCWLDPTYTAQDALRDLGTLHFPVLFSSTLLHPVDIFPTNSGVDNESACLDRLAILTPALAVVAVTVLRIWNRPGQ